MGRVARRSRETFTGLARTFKAVTGRPLASDAEALFSGYLDLLVLWNRAQSLTALDSPEEIVRVLFEDSLLFLALLPGRPLRLVDLGAGAGIPGVPLRIVDPGIQVTLVESRRKRVSFLHAVKRELGLDDLEIVEGRGEAVSRQVLESVGRFDVAVARAVGPSADLIPMALSYLKPHGRFIASGPPPNKLAERARLPAQAAWEVHDFPVIGLQRTFLVAIKED